MVVGWASVCVGVCWLVLGVRIYGFGCLFVLGGFYGICCLGVIALVFWMLIA